MGLIGKVYEIEYDGVWSLVEVLYSYNYSEAPIEAHETKKTNRYHKTIAVRDIGGDSNTIKYYFDYELKTTDKVKRFNKLNKILLDE